MFNVRSTVINIISKKRTAKKHRRDESDDESYDSDMDKKSAAKKLTCCQYDEDKESYDDDMEGLAPGTAYAP